MKTLRTLIAAKPCGLKYVTMIIPESLAVEEPASVGTECGKRSREQYRIGSHFFSPAVGNASDPR
jgi:hypothetical protein